MAVVRGTSDEAAFLRLRAGYDSGAPELLEAFDALAEKHLRVYAGQPRPTHAVCIPCASFEALKSQVRLLNMFTGLHCLIRAMPGKQQAWQPAHAAHIAYALLVLRCWKAEYLPSFKAVAT